MILRILEEGQFEIDDDALDELNALDEVVEETVEAADEPAFRAALAGLLDRVRALGSPLPDDALEPSDLVLPPADASLDEVRALLGDTGLIPG